MASKKRSRAGRPAGRVSPAKSIEELAKEQGIPRGPIDYEALFSNPGRGKKSMRTKRSQDLTPPKSIRELAKEQGIPDGRPDCVAPAVRGVANKGGGSRVPALHSLNPTGISRP